MANASQNILVFLNILNLDGHTFHNFLHEDAVLWLTDLEDKCKNRGIPQTQWSWAGMHFLSEELRAALTVALLGDLRLQQDIADWAVFSNLMRGKYETCAVTEETVSRKTSSQGDDDTTNGGVQTKQSLSGLPIFVRPYWPQKLIDRVTGTKGVGFKDVSKLVYSLSNFPGIDSYIWSERKSGQVLTHHDNFVILRTVCEIRSAHVFVNNAPTIYLYTMPLVEDEARIGNGLRSQFNERYVGDGSRPQGSGNLLFSKRLYVPPGQEPSFDQVLDGRDDSSSKWDPYPVTQLKRSDIIAIDSTVRRRRPFVKNDAGEKVKVNTHWNVELDITRIALLFSGSNNVQGSEFNREDMM